MTNVDNTLPCVTGYLADDWNPPVPAVVLNAAAPPIVLLGWCCAELQSLAAISAALAGSNRDLSAEEFAAIFEHRLPALVGVLGHAIGKLTFAQQSTAGEALQVQEGGAA